MLFVVLVAVALISVCVAVVWPRHGGTPGASGLASAAGSAEAELQGISSPESLEGILADQLMSGGITREQYLRAMCHLAARDAGHHPLEVPPDVVPPESA